MLRDYQAADIAELRPLVARHRSVLHQLPTGGGKTAEVAEIVRLIGGLNPAFVVWFVCPRNELIAQASEHFARWKIPHGLIAAGSEESRAFKVQIVSKDTLLASPCPREGMARRPDIRRGAPVLRRAVADNRGRPRAETSAESDRAYGHARAAGRARAIRSKPEDRMRVSTMGRRSLG